MNRSYCIIGRPTSLLHMFVKPMWTGPFKCYMYISNLFTWYMLLVQRLKQECACSLYRNEALTSGCRYAAQLWCSMQVHANGLFVGKWVLIQTYPVVIQYYQLTGLSNTLHWPNIGWTNVRPIASNQVPQHSTVFHFFLLCNISSKIRYQ